MIFLPIGKVIPILGMLNNPFRDTKSMDETKNINSSNTNDKISVQKRTGDSNSTKFIQF